MHNPVRSPQNQKTCNSLTVRQDPGAAREENLLEAPEAGHSQDPEVVPLPQK